MLYRVYAYFWMRSKWLTLGERFGADLLLYPDDPMYFHASHVIHVVRDARNRQIPVIELIAKGRLSIVVNKCCIFAYEDPDSKELRFQTLKWEGKNRPINQKTNLE